MWRRGRRRAWHYVHTATHLPGLSDGGLNGGFLSETKVLLSRYIRLTEGLDTT
jgi:hypothetical protein